MLNYIHDYRRELDDAQRIAGSVNEQNVSGAFAGLLKACGREHKLILKPEYPFRAKTGAALRADGVLLDRLQLVHGWWEAKDSRDDLDKEIAAKLAKGYPSDNIIFENTVQAVLLQNGQESRRVLLADDAGLAKLLEQFFAFRPPEVAQFEQAAAQFRQHLPTVLKNLADLIDQREADNALFREKLDSFHALCVRAIGKRVTRPHVREMLIQHILTEQIFRDLFPASAFHQENHLARALSEVEQVFLRGETRNNLLRYMEPYYVAIRRAAANAVAATEKQEFLKAVYEDFYTAYNPKDADRMGIVYTPAEVVRFIIQGCDTLARTHFQRGLADPEMDILDPCTGTGTFIVELLDYLRGDRNALIRKFAGEIHANEISILPYYIACLNIEQTFADITGQWREFTGACFVDTLENWGFEKTYSGAQGSLLGTITDENQHRIQEQNARRIPVIIGNPPYNANQQNENDNNKNVVAQEADERIKATYLKASNAQKTKLYDPYVRFIRWATDRIGEEGIIGFVTNRSYLDARGFDGFRKVVADDFQEIWIIDLQSDVRRNPKISGTKHNVFGIQTGVAIVFFIRNPRCDGCEIYYLAVDDFLTATEKRRFLATHPLVELKKQGEFQRIIPNAAGDWINQPTQDWSNWLALADKEVKRGNKKEAIFNLYSLGISTNRDEWIYGFDTKSLADKIRYFSSSYTANRQDIKWSRNLKRRFDNNLHEPFNEKRMQLSTYRPFIKVLLYRSPLLIDEIGSADKIFTLGKKNLVIAFSNPTSPKPFVALSVNAITDLHCIGDTALVPLKRYDQGGSYYDNITHWSLSRFQDHYADPAITKLAIFHYVYAVLHDPVYRETYALNLKREFPRIPFYPDFRQWAAWGEQLMTLHLGFENVEPWPLRRIEKPTPPTPLPQAGEGRIKPRLKADKTAGRIEIDPITELENVPADAWEYRLGHRSALEWILEEYKESTPRDPTIREKFNTYRFADHKEKVIDLLTRVCRVSVETVQITKAMRAVSENSHTEAR
ncbi:MAG: N-6 DNA methylase [Candidatus Contendobacter sp.]|jgi:predicted helicase|nr:N-6 DNA methylase [Gammaproteobacteria bacterium]MCC8992320.1 N-6 DNA methylase [Candidatus Contendobacter sp.]